MVVYFIKNNKPLQSEYLFCSSAVRRGDVRKNGDFLPSENLAPGTRELPLPLEKFPGNEMACFLPTFWISDDPQHTPRYTSTGSADSGEFDILSLVESPERRDSRIPNVIRPE